MGYYTGKEIVLGVTGSIAAYKACDIASRLVEAGARVLPVLTRGAENFLGAASLEAITGNRVITQMFDAALNPDIEHIAVARRADLFLIAPATANILAKAAHGLADDWLSTTLLAARCPVLFAPAMNMHMYAHPATQTNIDTLRSRGCLFVGPEPGALACGDVGPGRLIETRAILEAGIAAMNSDKTLAGKTVLITSGANHEPIDPVRYIGNRSSGRMGYALALEALRRGANVVVVTGPREMPLPHAAEVIEAPTARSMHEAVMSRAKSADIFIGAAAVADYRVESPEQEKHKRNGREYRIDLVQNPDIAAEIGARKKPGQIIVGFAAETNELKKRALEKLRRKNLDIIVCNQVGGEESAIGAAVSSGMFLTAEDVEPFTRLDKQDIAIQLFDRMHRLRHRTILV